MILNKKIISVGVLDNNILDFSQIFYILFFFFMFPFWKTSMVELYSLWNIKNSNISVHCLQSRVKLTGGKGEDTSKVGVTSMEKKHFSFQKRNFFQKNR